jgi:hypothetical protein
MWQFCGSIKNRFGACGIQHAELEAKSIGVMHKQQ